MANIGKGLGAIREASKNSTTTLKIKSGESAIIRILTPADEIISVWEHVEEIGGNWHTITCLGKNACPMCQAGKKARFTAYLVVADKTKADEVKVKLFKAGKKVAVQLLGLVEEYGDLSKRDFKLFRQGEKLDTTYQFFPRDPSVFDASDLDIPDVEDMVKPLSRDAIISIMNGGGTVSEVADEKATGGESTSDNDYPF